MQYIFLWRSGGKIDPGAVLSTALVGLIKDGHHVDVIMPTDYYKGGGILTKAVIVTSNSKQFTEHELLDQLINGLSTPFTQLHHP